MQGGRQDDDATAPATLRVSLARPRTAGALQQLLRGRPQRVRVPDRLRPVPAGRPGRRAAHAHRGEPGPGQAASGHASRHGVQIRGRTRRASLAERLAGRAGIAAARDARLREPGREGAAGLARETVSDLSETSNPEEVIRMRAQIRANRLEVSDRFPVLGFTIRTDESPARAEVAVATHPSLLRAEMKAKRTTSSFYSSRAGGMLAVPRGEAVYLVPPEVLARFVGQERLYVGLAVGADRNGGALEVAVLPTEGSPYVSLKGLTGRSLKRVRMLPRPSRGGRYDGGANGSLEWAGDTATPGVERAGNGTAPAPAGAAPSSSHGQPKAGGAAPAVDSDDRLG